MRKHMIKTLGVRLTADQYRRVEQLADAAEMRPSEWARAAIILAVNTGAPISSATKLGLPPMTAPAGGAT